MADKANMSKTVDFDSEQPETTDQNTDQQEDGDTADESIVENKQSTQENTAQEYDISDSAIVLGEDENSVFTSEGIISKSSIQKKDNSDSNDKTEPDEKEKKILDKFESVDDLKKAYKDLEKKLGKSGEAVNQLKELEPVLPLMEAMLNDPEFLDLADGYFNDPKAQKEAVRKSLGLDEDFEFDLEKALADPKSDDAKVLEKITQKRQQKQTKQTNTNKNQSIPEDQKKEFMQKHDMTEDDFEDMMNKAGDYKISLDDIHFLMNKDKILSQKEKEAQEKIKEQMKNARETGKTNGTGGGSPQKSAEDMFMDSISGSGGGLFS